MINAACSRREFLKKLALIFGGVVLAGGTINGCGPDLPRNALPSLVGIYFYDGHMNKFELRGDQNVPVNAVFTFVFSKDMNTDLHASSYQTGVNFLDSNNNPINFDIGWVNARTLYLTPASYMSFGTHYVITVFKAEDSIGNPLNDYADNSASFKTASF